ncbi:hypothetical protein GENT11_18270 [Flavobacterium ammonificans]|uniref:Uncharacterized protein n=1 Tax=Flavobacterium ammonificans TaxID=1751056 RepID=A0ABM7V175_9FLAO|nr:hypothetical protein GENT11_18270 [Flavobacterium ammonificans]
MNSDNYNQLRIDVEKQIGFRIKKLSELKMAQEAIEWETKKKLVSIHFDDFLVF